MNSKFKRFLILCLNGYAVSIKQLGNANGMDVPGRNDNRIQF
jgi:hypothetical protein